VKIMSEPSRKLLLWSPRIVGIAVCLFLGMFALDSTGRLPDFVAHVAPVLALLVAVLLSWRWEWVGAVVFIGVAFAYAWMARDHLAWIPLIAGPLLLAGILFSLSWLRHEELRA